MVPSFRSKGFWIIALEVNKLIRERGGAMKRVLRSGIIIIKSFDLQTQRREQVGGVLITPKLKRSLIGKRL